jgi:hypothetical protein
VEIVDDPVNRGDAYSVLIHGFRGGAVQYPLALAQELEETLALPVAVIPDDLVILIFVPRIAGDNSEYLIRQAFRRLGEGDRGNGVSGNGWNLPGSSARPSGRRRNGPCSSPVRDSGSGTPCGSPADGRSDFSMPWHPPGTFPPLPKPGEAASRISSICPVSGRSSVTWPKVLWPSPFSEPPGQAPLLATSCGKETDSFMY